jgi:hypothetical protein
MSATSLPTYVGNSGQRSSSEARPTYGSRGVSSFGNTGLLIAASRAL